MNIGSPFTIQSKPYIIASKAIVASTDQLASEDAAEVTPAVAIGEVETPMTTGRSGSWIIISVVVVLGVVAAGFAIYKKTTTV